MREHQLPLILVFLGSFILFQKSFAQLTVTSEIRPRAEYRHGFSTLAFEDQDPAFFIDQRTRLNLDFKLQDIQTFLSIQDIRVWGNQPQLVRNDGALTAVHQAWAKVNLSKKWALKIGRQEINYDDHRILGNVGWAQQARSHDAGIFIYQDSTFSAHLGLAFNQDRPQLNTTLYTTPRNYKSIQYLWLHKDWNSISGSFLFLNNGVQVIYADGDFETNFSQTIGGRLTWKQNKMSVNLAAYYQGGTHNDTLDTKISAYYLGLDIAYALPNNITLGAGVEILSGNDQLDNNGKNNAFNPFYGTNHKFNGLMDYFYVGNHAGNVGLNDFFVTGKYRKAKFNAGLAVHLFQTNANLAENGNALGKTLGTEIDYTMGWSLFKGTSLVMGYSQLFATDSMVALKDGDKDAFQNWIWAMITIKPSFSINVKK